MDKEHTFHWRDVAVPLVSVLLGGALATWGSMRVQQSQLEAERDRYLTQLRIADQEKAIQALLEIGPLVDAPLVRAQVYYAAVRAERPDTTTRRMKREYEEARQDWRERFSRTRLLIGVYFGDKQVGAIERLDSQMTSADKIVQGAREEMAEARQSRVGLKRHKSVAYRDAMREAIKAGEAGAQARADLLEILVRGGYTNQRILGEMIKHRQTGSFDPLAQLGLTWQEEQEAVARARRRADSLKKRNDSLAKAGANTSE